MKDAIRQEWGAALFVGTVAIGAVVIAIAFILGAGHQPTIAALPPCPSYTPYAPTASPSPGVTPAPVPTVTALDVATVNCPTAPVAPPSATAPASSTAAPSATSAPSPTPAGTPVPTPVS